MANVSRIRGFRPVEGLATGAWTALIRQYPKTAGGTSTNLFIGDVVTIDGTALDGSVIQAATSETVVGVVVALGLETTFEGQTGYFDPDNLTKRHLLAAEAGIVGVVPAELSLFEAYSILDASPDLDLGDLIDFVLGTGDTITGNSTYTLSTTNTNGDCRVVEQVTAPDNDPTIANSRYIVKFNTTLNTL